jgi:hypothetical protein
MMTYSYTQLSRYLACPRRYRYQYLDGWEEKEVRAAMLFGRAFEQALAAYFRGQDSTVVLFEAWQAEVRGVDLTYGKGESWDQLLKQGTQLLQRFAQDDRVRIPAPQQNLQIKVLRRLDADSDFVGYIDAIAELDGVQTVLDWKTTSSCYPSEPAGLLRLDPQLLCYSWLTGIAEVALVVFVRKRVPEIQYLKATISPAARHEFGLLARHTAQQIAAANFLAHSGIRFPQNQCVSCAFSGLCLDQQELVEAKLRRRTGAELGWLDELDY